MSDVIADPSSSARENDEADGRRGGGFGSLGSIVYLLVLTWAAAIASYPLNDNSFFTHLATGRLILERGSVPSSDPYTFTAQGEPWTVQSWLASVAYAGAERMAADVGLRVLILAVFVVAMTLLWRLTAPARSIITRVLIMVLALPIVSELWGERPYMIGVIGLAAVWLALEGHVRPWVLVPLLWLWTNVHGSFPLATILCGAVLAGGVLDRRRMSEELNVPDHEKRTVGAVLLGSALGAIGPLGAKILLFPLTAITKSDVLQEIIEWRPPGYRSTGERAFLVLVVVTVLVLSQQRQWRLTLPAVGFAAMALYAQRNVVMATVVLVAVLAVCAPAAGSLRSEDRPPLGLPLATIMGVLAVAASALAVGSPVDGFGGYPVRALAYLESMQVSGRAATEMPAGNLLEALDGATGEVFIDDRVDMFGEDLFDDFLTLRRGSAGWEAVLDEHGIDVVVWGREQPLASIIAASPHWAQVFADTTSIVACRRSTCSPSMSCSSGGCDAVADT